MNERDSGSFNIEFFWLLTLLALDLTFQQSLTEHVIKLQFQVQMAKKNLLIMQKVFLMEIIAQIGL